MNESTNKLKENKNNVLIGALILILGALFVFYFYFGAADKDITQETGPVFQTTSYNFTFAPGEVKITTGDEVNARNFV